MRGSGRYTHSLVDDQAAFSGVIAPFFTGILSRPFRWSYFVAAIPGAFVAIAGQRLNSDPFRDRIKARKCGPQDRVWTISVGHAKQGALLIPTDRQWHHPYQPI